MRAKALVSRRDVRGVAVYSRTLPKVEVLTGLMRRVSALLDMDEALAAADCTGSQLLNDIAELEAMSDAPAPLPVEPSFSPGGRLQSSAVPARSRSSCASNNRSYLSA